MKIKITYVQHFDKDKTGKPYTNANGAFKKCLIKCEEKGDQYISMYGSKTTESWKVGDLVDVEIEEKNVNGKIYLNGKVPSSGNTFELARRLGSLEGRVEVMQKEIDALKEEMKKKSADPILSDNAVAEGINIDDIPF